MGHLRPGIGHDQFGFHLVKFFGTELRDRNVQFFESAVKVINTVNNKVTASIPVGAMPGAIAVTPNGTRVY